jgi:hypothetical protein
VAPLELLLARALVLRGPMLLVLVVVLVAAGVELMLLGPLALAASEELQAVAVAVGAEATMKKPPVTAAVALVVKSGSLNS